MDEPTPIPPETKDWTVVIADGCDECGYRPHDVSTTGALLRASIPCWRERLAGPEVRRRPAPTTWSPLEYGAHVRDVCRVFLGRLELMLTAEHPTFPDWDQDAAAVDGEYFREDPQRVADEYEQSATRLADAFDAVDGDQWQRTGMRGDGWDFTVGTFAIYLTHDIHHHLQDAGA